MKHLSQQQIQMLADEALEGNERDILLQHTQECSRCGRELAFQRSLVSAVRQVPVVKPSGRFTATVMERVAPELRGGIIFRFLGNFGNILAMAAVIGVIGYALTFNLPSTVTAQPFEPSDFSKMISHAYDAFQHFFSSQSNQVTTTVAEKTSLKGPKVSLMALASLIILVLIDRFVFKSYNRMRFKS